MLESKGERWTHLPVSARQHLLHTQRGCEVGHRPARSVRVMGDCGAAAVAGAAGARLQREGRRSAIGDVDGGDAGAGAGGKERDERRAPGRGQEPGRHVARGACSQAGHAMRAGHVGGRPEAGERWCLGRLLGLATHTVPCMPVCCWCQVCVPPPAAAPAPAPPPGASHIAPTQRTHLSRTKPPSCPGRNGARRCWGRLR